MGHYGLLIDPIMSSLPQMQYDGATVANALFTVMTVMKLSCDCDVTATKPVSQPMKSNFCHIFIY